MKARLTREEEIQAQQLSIAKTKALKAIAEGLAETDRVERTEAAARQEKAGIKDVARTDFLRLDPEKDAVMDRIWKAGPRAKTLYIRIAKGLATLTWPDVIKLSARADIETLADGLVKGMTLKEVIPRKATLFTSLRE